MELIGLNAKWYRYQNGIMQEEFANKTKFKLAYISIIETGSANLTYLIILFLNSFKAFIIIFVSLLYIGSFIFFWTYINHTPNYIYIIY